MKVTNNQRKFTQGFTLIEMIGVLAVIAILASMLIPKIFEAINSARINNTIQSYNAIKTAVMDHYGKYGAINFNGFTQQPAVAAELAAYDAGCRRFDSAIGGLGGCPFAQDALVGNIPTEKTIEALRQRGAQLPALKSLDTLLKATGGIAAKYSESHAAD